MIWLAYVMEREARANPKKTDATAAVTRTLHVTTKLVEMASRHHGLDFVPETHQTAVRHALSLDLLQ